MPIFKNKNGNLVEYSNAQIMAEGKLGVGKPDGKTIFVDHDGTLSAKAGLTIPPKNPTNVSVKASDGTLTVSWTDPEDNIVDGTTLAKWGGTILLYNADHVPTDENDGIVVVNNTTRNQYATDGIEISGLTNNQLYNLYFVPYTTDGVKGYSDNNRYAGKPSKVLLDDITDIKISAIDGLFTVSWTNPSQTKTKDNVTATWAKTTVVVKAGSEPANENDGTAYVSTSYEEKSHLFNLENGYDYYVGFFIESDIGSVTHTTYDTPTATYAVVNVTTDETTLYGKEITATYGEGQTVKAAFSDSGNASMKIPYCGEVSFTATDGEETADGSVKITFWQTYAVELSFATLVPFSTASIEDLEKMVNAFYNDKFTLDDIKSVCAVGDMRSVDLSAMEATGVSESHREQDVQYVILDFEHDELTTPINGHTKALFSIGQKDCLMDAECEAGTKYGSRNTENGYMNSTNTNSGGWRACARRTWCNNVYFNALPTEWQNMIKEVNKKTSAGNSSSEIETVTDKIFLAAEIEVLGSRSYSVDGEGTQYQYYKNATANRYKMPKYNTDYGTVSDAYFMRSPRNNNGADVCCIGYNGKDSVFNACNTYGIAPHMCI